MSNQQKSPGRKKRHERQMKANEGKTDQGRREKNNNNIKYIFEKNKSPEKCERRKSLVIF